MLEHAICDYVQQIKLINIAWKGWGGGKGGGGSCLGVLKSDYVTLIKTMKALARDGATQ